VGCNGNGSRNNVATGSRWWRWAQLTAWQTLVCLLIGVSFLAGTCYFGGAGVRQLLLSRSVSEWKLVLARIEAVELKRVPTDRGSLWLIEATYSYEVAGKRHVGRKVSPDAFPPDNKEAQHVRYNQLKAYEGTDVPWGAWVSPHNPQDSVLFREALTSAWPNIAGGGAMALFAIIPLLAGIRSSLTFLLAQRNQR
jgi:Protein of unknown function (DUF3592)